MYHEYDYNKNYTLPFYPQPQYTYVNPSVGWSCPKCYRCYAPNVPMCMWCVPTPTTYGAEIGTPIT